VISLDMDKKEVFQLIWRNSLFWLSRELDYPLVPPDMLQLCFTFRCNLRCKMCSMQDKLEELKAKGKPYELSFSLMKDLILQAYNMKIREVFFVGGEPFLETKIFELIKYASQLNMSTVVTTNGVLLNEGIINNIFDSGLLYLTFSIDGPDKETHENIRGKDIFEKIISNLNALILKKRERNLTGPKVTILCTVMKQNISKLPQMVDFANKLGVDWLQFQPVVPDNADQSRDIISDTWIGPESYDLLDGNVDKIIRLKYDKFPDFIVSSFQQLQLMKSYYRNYIQNRRKCYIGFNRLMVTQDRKIYFCASDPKNGDVSFGDVSQHPLKKLWKSKEASKFRKYIKKCKRPCLLFCAYRPEFDTMRDGPVKIIKRVIPQIS